MVKACIFDLDGVIVDTAKYHYMAWKRLAAELGVELTETENEKLKGVGRQESLEIILSLAGIDKTEQEKVRLADKKNIWFVDYVNAMKPNEIFPGVLELLEELSAKGVKVALASSSKNALTVVNKLGIKSRFEVIIDGNMIKNSKPDPEIFLKAAKRLNIQSKDCIVVEDAAAGVEAAKRAGMKCIGIGDVSRLKMADHVVDRTGQLSYKILCSA